MSLRYERKYIVPPLFFSLESLIRTHPANFQEVYHFRHVNSLYFDDVAWTSLVDSEEGFFNRQKIRIRCYGTSTDQVARPVLEFKTKQGFLGTKDIFRLPDFELSSQIALFRESGWMDDLDLPDWVKKRLKFVQPVLLNRYARRYFLSQDKRYRITIDADICYYPVHGRTCRLDRIVHDPNSPILELKYEYIDDTDVNPIIQHLPFRLARNSKYCTGMILTKSIEDNSSGLYP
jgi:hypothetical protein